MVKQKIPVFLHFITLFNNIWHKQGRKFCARANTLWYSKKGKTKLDLKGLKLPKTLFYSSDFMKASYVLQEVNNWITESLPWALQEKVELKCQSWQRLWKGKKKKCRGYLCSSNTGPIEGGERMKKKKNPCYFKLVNEKGTVLFFRLSLEVTAGCRDSQDELGRAVYLFCACSAPFLKFRCVL